MAIIAHTLKDGGKSYSVVVRANGKQKWKRFRTKREASAYQDTLRTRVREGTYQEVNPLPFGEVMDRWLRLEIEQRVQTGDHMKRSTADLYRQIVDTHLRPAFGQVRSDRLTPAMIAEWRGQQAALIGAGKATPATFNFRFTVLQAIVKWARRSAQKHLAHDPLVDAKRLQVRQVERECLTLEDTQRLLAAASPPDDTIIRLAAFTGLRRGEVFGLMWEDVDFDRQVLTVRHNLVAGRLETPKSVSSARVVDVPRAVLDDLAIHRLNYPPITGPRGCFVFRDATGEPLKPDTFHERLQRIALGIGLQARRLGLHTLRHNYATLMDDEPLKYVSAQLGHASTKITADLYQHVLRKRSVDAMARLDTVIAGASKHNPNVPPPTTAHDGRDAGAVDAPEVRAGHDQLVRLATTGETALHHRD